MVSDLSGLRKIVALLNSELAAVANRGYKVGLAVVPFTSTGNVEALMVDLYAILKVDQPPQ